MLTTGGCQNCRLFVYIIVHNLDSRNRSPRNKKCPEKAPDIQMLTEIYKQTNGGLPPEIG